MRSHRTRSRRLGSCVALAFALITTSAGGQTIDSLSEASAARSSRLLVFGGGFGAEQGAGRVLVDGAAAIVTTWTDSEIHAYVPETASLGEVAVVVEAAGGGSNPHPLTVTLRASEGRFRWRFEVDDRTIGPWIGRGPDGTVYTSDRYHLYALAPDGELLWALRGAGSTRPITFAPDGMIVTAAQEVAGQPQGVVGVNPDGTLRWIWEPADGYDLMTGPGVGPDGNVYATSNTNLGGPGTFALDPDGNLLWNLPGPGANTINNHEIDFAPDRFYVSFHGQGGPANIVAYDYDGNLLWHSDDLGQTMGSAPELDPWNRLVLSWGLIGVQVWRPDGAVEWIYDPPGSLGNVVVPAVGPDGVIYNGTWGGGDLFAVNPDGTTRWLIEDGIDGFLWHLAVTPDNRMLLDGGAPDFGEPSRIRAFSTADGALLWEQSFHFEDGLNEFARWVEPAFSADGRTAYVTTRFSSDTKPSSLYAVDITLEASVIFEDGFESGGLQAWSSVVE